MDVGVSKFRQDEIILDHIKGLWYCDGRLLGSGVVLVDIIVGALAYYADDFHQGIECALSQELARISVHSLAVI